MGIVDVLAAWVDELPRLSVDLVYVIVENWFWIIGIAALIDLGVTLPLYYFYRKGKQDVQSG